jgi:DnaJ-class molecular chaperone
MVNAYEVLKDSKKRKIYDEYGEEGLTNPEMGEEFDPFEFFIKNKSKEKFVELSITLEEAYNGAKKEVKYDRVIILPKFKGFNPSEETTCLKCNGSDKKKIISNFYPNIIGFQTGEICDICNGEGKITKEKYKE